MLNTEELTKNYRVVTFLETLRYRVECSSFYPSGFIHTRDMKAAHSFFETLQNLYG